MSYSVLLTPGYRDIFTQYRNSFSTGIDPVLLARYRVWPTRVGPMSNSIWVGADPIPRPIGQLEQATAEATIDADGTLGIAYLVNPGQGYFNTPSVTAPLPLPSTVATFDVTVGFGGVLIFNAILVNGFGYFAGPYSVFIDPPPGPGIQATATVTITNGSVTGFVFTDPGAGYVGIPNIFVTPGPLASAQATFSASLSGGTVSSITVINQGQNYNPLATPLVLTVSAPP